MIRVDDLMLVNPPFIYVNDTVGQARIIANHSWFKSIPVLFQNGIFAGILDRNLVCQERLPVDSVVESYIETSVTSINSGAPLAVISEIPLVSGVSVLPVLAPNGTMAGIIPDPDFLKTVCKDIIDCLPSVFTDNKIDLSTHGIIVINDEGKIVYFSHNAEKILGLKGKEVYGIHINKIIHDSKLCEVVKKGQPQLKDKLQADNVILGSNRFPLFKGREVVGAIAVFEDISEKEQLHKRLRKLRGLNLEMVGILESMNDGILVMDNYGKVIRINSAFETITGISANKILEGDIKFLIDSGCLPGFIVSEVLEKKKSVHVIDKNKDRDFLFIANPVFDGDGKLVRVVIILKDINYLNELILNLQVTQELATRYYQELETTKDRLGREEMIASSMAMRRVVSLAHKVARVDSNVLIMGETGVGKEVVARSIHKCSHRMDGPFIKLNCGAIPEPLLESELFGYESGAFTGAKKEGKAGLIELADGGTLFLDEVADLPMNLQVKLLRVLQEREVMRVGGTRSKKVDFRLIAATNQDLEQMVKQNTFREDLYYRLNVVPVCIPPLRERKEDIVPLIIFFLNKFNKKYGLNKKISPEVIQNMLKYDWPGNIRELENTVERLVVTSDRNLIQLEDMKEKTRIEDINHNNPKILPVVLEETEKKLIYQALQHCKTTREMADILGISQSAVVKKMKKYGISRIFE